MRKAMVLSVGTEEEQAGQGAANRLATYWRFNHTTRECVEVVFVRWNGKFLAKPLRRKESPRNTGGAITDRPINVENGLT